jgi:hypothetical protein
MVWHLVKHRDKFNFTFYHKNQFTGRGANWVNPRHITTEPLTSFLLSLCFLTKHHAPLRRIGGIEV